MKNNFYNSKKNLALQNDRYQHTGKRGNMWKYEEHPEDREEMELKANLLKLNSGGRKLLSMKIKN